MARFPTFIFAVLLVSADARARTNADEAATDNAKAVAAAREKGLDWLTKHQEPNGAWSKGYSIAVTSFACLAYLSAADEPFINERGKALVKGLQFLLANQKDGQFSQQGHTWIHGQGFATLALSEAYGRSLLCKTKPDLDMKKVRAVVVQAVQAIAKHQSTSGGWWYTPGAPEQHEGSTTVCAVQALVSARNYGIAIDEKVLEKGFEYLKKCQSEDGGFNYKLGDGTSMKEGTAADVATLGLMQKFDFPVMIKGYKFLVKLTPAAISAERFPYYGHFYGCMGMQLLGQEYKDDKSFREGTTAYITRVQKDLLAWQQKDGTWPLKGHFASGSQEDGRYATAFAVLTLFVPEARLSVYNRTPPKLPGGAERRND
jgi:prenyltransferase beta subunit